MPTVNMEHSGSNNDKKLGAVNMKVKEIFLDHVYVVMQITRSLMLDYTVVFRADDSVMISGVRSNRQLDCPDRSLAVKK